MKERNLQVNVNNNVPLHELTKMAIAMATCDLAQVGEDAFVSPEVVSIDWSLATCQPLACTAIGGYKRGYQHHTRTWHVYPSWDNPNSLSLAAAGGCKFCKEGYAENSCHMISWYLIGWRAVWKSCTDLLDVTRFH